MENKTLSVVVPVYNGVNCIKDCLDALLNQTYQELEIIVVNDGSDDETLDILNEYAKKDFRINVFSRSNMGVSATRNEGISHAKGDYIFFCDADDYPEPDLAERYVQAINEWENSDMSLICCGMFFDNRYNKNVKNKKCLLESAYGFVEGENYLISRAAASTLAWLKMFNFVTNKCYNLNFIKENDIKFDRNINIGEDLRFNLDYLDKCSGNIGVINKCLYHYVKRTGDSLSITYHADDLEDTKYIYRRFINWITAQKGVTEENILVVKSIYINDWVCRLSSMYEASLKRKTANTKDKLSKELKSKEFQTTLKEIYAAKKISTLRYVCLRTGMFQIFYFFRGIYQFMKG
ncbi:glycosyltransferase family 2 protein [Pseudobutyrivibrio xylanivorans]|uniref:Glycosyl transferase family 2 n=1 Tax=Pseudobutyrivibrio xylanivorans DSM 14809 TaxID=1123012 RepID=A0A1M6IGG4_PSEXY|nr:glycosyltransferase family 2 protein [Pseudobutyrivibrio xylanivorans]SHJ33509.1 Glycosyl transferase family 2 [Pseudobutyrivibrio xylanivorans DSM 14809]